MGKEGDVGEERRTGERQMSRLERTREDEEKMENEDGQVHIPSLMYGSRTSCMLSEDPSS